MVISMNESTRPKKLMKKAHNPQRTRGNQGKMVASEMAICRAKQCRQVFPKKYLILIKGTSRYSCYSCFLKRKGPESLAPEDLARMPFQVAKQMRIENTVMELMDKYNAMGFICDDGEGEKENVNI